MRIFLFLSFLFFSNTIVGQFSEEEVITLCEVCNPTDIFSADLDGDEDMDILSASGGDNKIAWCENL